MLRTITASFAAAMLLASVGFAQVPASAPAGSTGLCKDGTYWSGLSKRGACSGHKGVKEWYGTPSSAPTGSAASGAAAAPAATTPAPAAATPTPAATTAAAPVRSNSMPAAAAAPGGGPGMVWVNKNSKVYHCPSDRWYGKTKNGVYMSEADATAQGNRPDHGKACH